MPMHNPPHPGSVLREYLVPVSVTDAARHLGLTRAALSRVLNGSAGISADMALRLSDALGTSPELWTGMQAQYELWEASRRRRKIAPLVVAHGVEEEELDRKYIEGYRRKPESAAMGKLGARLAKEVWPKETWDKPRTASSDR